MKKFKEYPGLNLSDVNKELLSRWNKLDVFHKSIETREGKPSFVFYEGPPSANGLPGIHHVMGRTIKDVFCRYKTMQGFQVKRKAGWDTHGLPVELGVEKALGITKEDIGKTISVDDYNAACRHDVLKYTKEWEDLTTQMGYWVDMNDPYITYDNRYIETLWWLLKQLYNKNLLYKGYTIQPFSPAAGTGLSTHELNQPGCYRDVKDTTCIAQFKAIKNKKSQFLFDEVDSDEIYFIAWTTTPWTLPSNTALCVGPNVDYQLIKTTNPYTQKNVYLILANELVPTYFAAIEVDEHNINKNKIPYCAIPTKKGNSLVPTIKGSDLVGLEYEQLIPWVNPGEGAFKVIAGNFVTTEDGTGIVHIAPTFGADDDRVAKQNGVPPMLLIDKGGNSQPMVDRSGKFFELDNLDVDFVKEKMNVSLYMDFEGRYVKNAYDTNLNENDETLDISICMLLKKQGLAFKIEKHTHNYPHCWRTDKPVLYYPLDSWFIKTTEYKEKMIELNNTINWKPQSTGSGRFGKWLENLQDWNLSRSRYWGTPLPIWGSNNYKHLQSQYCVGSKEEFLEKDKNNEAKWYYCGEKFEKFSNDILTNEDFRNQIINKISNIQNTKTKKELKKLKHELSTKIFQIENWSSYHVYFEIFKDYLDPITKELLNNDKFDLHKPFVDKLIKKYKKGFLCRESDLIDVWFDSGAMPYAQMHYPFENKELIDNHTNFPADFISEGVDQTRGWFFTLHAISTMIKGSVAFKNVISNGLVLDKNGNKMSKRLGNGVDPFSAIEKYGSDPLRWYMMTNASPWDNLKFDIEGVEEVRRKFFGTLYNTYSFFSLYANVDKFTYAEAEIPMEKRPEIDRWIISLLNTLVKDVTEFYETYEPTRAGRAISDFVGENLSNWYVRLNRKRYWGGEYDEDKISAYQTLYTCLETVSRLMAPIAPFFADQLFLDLNAVTGKDTIESVHLADFPGFNDALIDSNLEECMQLAQQTSSMILALRRKADKKVRQPLTKAVVPAPDDVTFKQLSYIADLVKAEVNVKELEVIPPDNDMENLVKKIKPNFKTLGKKYGKQMKEIAQAMNSFGNHEIAEIERNGRFIITLPTGDVELTPEDVEIITEDMPGWLVSNEGKLTVALDITLTDALLREGIARELVNRIQNIRKSNGYEIVDKIEVEIESRNEINEAVNEYAGYIASQTLANSVLLSSNISDATELEFDEYIVKVSVKKV